MSNNTFNKVNAGLRSYYGFQVFISIFLAILSSIGGIYFVTKKEKYNKVIDAEIISVEDCDKYVSHTSNNVKNYKHNCYIEYKFKVNDKEYINTGVTKSKKIYKVGNNVKIEYDSSNPSDNRVDKFPIKYIGYGLFGLSLFLLIIAITYHFVSKTKGAGAGMLAVNAVSRIGR